MILTNFSVRYKTEYGRALYIIGDSINLGYWILSHAVRLVWSEGDFWSKTLAITQIQTRYKYFEASYIDSTDNVKWEGGPNRVYSIIQDQIIFNELHDSWNQDQDTFYQYNFEKQGEGKVQCDLKNSNITQTQQYHYEGNCQILYEKQSKKLYKFDDNIYIGEIPRTDSDFDFIKIQNLQTVVEFVQEDTPVTMPFKNFVKDINYIRINLVALKCKHYSDFWEYLYALIKVLVSKFDTFLLCNKSMKYLKKYLGYYKKLEKLNQTKDKTFNKTLSFSVSPLKMKPNDLYG